jgi:hypothetical protein
MKTHLNLLGLASLLLLAATSARAATPFSAELVEHRGEQTLTGAFSCQEGGYRFETQDDGRALVVIVDTRGGPMRVLSTAEKMYIEAPADGPFALFANPFAAYAQLARQKEVRTEGTEPIGGIACTKQVVFSGEQVFVVAWVSTEFAVPLKVESPLAGRTFELRNIVRGPQDPALLALPAGFTKAPEVDTKPHVEWAAQVAKAPQLAPPFEKTLPEGAIVRVRPQAGRHLRITGSSATGAESALTVVAFKAGAPLNDPDTAGLEGDNAVTITPTQTPAEADEIVIRIRQGSVKVKVDTIAATKARDGSVPPPAAPTTAIEGSVSVSAPAAAAMASQVEIFWAGPGNKDDFIAIARADQPPRTCINRVFVRDGNPVKLWMPGEPGDFELRYVQGRGNQVLATAPITADPVFVNVEAIGHVDAGAWIEVKWEGPAAERDFISVAQPQQKPEAFVAQALVTQGNPLRVRAPGTPGDYEVRYVFKHGAKVLAGIPIAVLEVEAAIQPPATVKADARFEVTWEGPGYPEDFVSIARTNQPPGASLNLAKLRTGVPAKLRAPKEPGTYEIRYVLGLGRRALAKTTITVEPASP